MKSMNLVTLMAVLGTTVLLGACGVKVGTGEGGGPKPIKPSKFGDDKASIPGPVIAGAWESDCNADWTRTGIYRKFSITYTADQVDRSELSYSDSKCQQLKETQRFTGVYRFIEKLKADIYVVQYAFDIGNGATQVTMENVLLENGKLYIGNFASGEGMGVYTKEPLSPKAPSQSTIPNTQPPNVRQAQVAESYSEARFAICNTQGKVIVMDLEQASLTMTNNGWVRFAGQGCAASEPVSWGARDFEVAVTINGGFPQLVSKNTGYGRDRIETSSNGSGLKKNGYPKAAYGVLGGNSGPCYFLKSVGKIDQLPEMCN